MAPFGAQETIVEIDYVHDLDDKQTHLCFHLPGEVLCWDLWHRTVPRTVHSRHTPPDNHPPKQLQIHGSLGSSVVPLAQLSLSAPPALPEPLPPSAPGACTPAAESLQGPAVVEQASVFWAVELGLLGEGSSVLPSPVRPRPE